MKHRKYLTPILALALVISGCGPGATPTKQAPPTKPPASEEKPAPTQVPEEPTSPPEPVTLLFWCHWANERTKQEVLQAAAEILEERHPNVKVEFTWWSKTEMFNTMRNAFTAGEGFPDIFYWDRLALEFIESGWLADLTDAIDWSEVETWAMESWQLPGPDGTLGIWAVPLETQTDEIYYNKDIFDDLGITVPEDYKFTIDEFYNVCVKIREAGIDPFANAIGDYNTMSAYLPNMILARQLGAEDLYKLYRGEKSWKDPEVVEAMEWVKKFIDIPVYSASFSTMNISESHVYFHTQQKAAMYMVGNWYTGRAFLPVDEGGQPSDFNLGMLRYPTMPNGKGNDIRLSGVAGAISVAEMSSHKDLALELLQIIASTEIGNIWVEKTAGITGMVTTTAGGEYEDYFKEYDKVHEGEVMTPFVYGMLMPPNYLDAFLSVIDEGLSLGQISLEDAIEQMEEARLAIPSE